ncbi:MAG: TRAP transporter permease [Bacillota bacterium]|nr:TRAP transporter permease [Bacillota bacterium]
MNSNNRPYYWDSQKFYTCVVASVGVTLALFHIYTGLWGSFDALKQRAIHLGLGLIMVFIIYPISKKGISRLHFLDYLLALASIVVTAYPLFRYDWITAERFSLITPLSTLEKVLAVLAILLILEAVRRIVGNSLLTVVLCFLAYIFVGPFLPGAFRSVTITWTQFLDFQYLSTAGIFGIPLGVSANEIALFIVFAAILMKSGGSLLMNNLAVSLAGRSPGGPAKVAVLASGLMGTISGSGTANVMTTGSVTIPMMKKIGYPAHFAGAVEAVASTGGQIMPPVMGAAAFVMSAFSGIPYIQILKFAIIPALLFYWGLLVSVHLEALRLNLSGVEPEISAKQTIKDYGHMLIPILVLLFILFSGYTPRMAAGAGVISAILFSQLRSTTRLGLKDLLEALINGARGMLVVIVATSAAGIIIGSIELTGSGHRIGTLFMSLSGGYQIPALILAMLLAIILGMGMPTSAAYVIQAATVIPALLYFGIEPYVAHMFCFYFACLSLITPPVAITSYAAAGLAGANIWKTGWTAFRLGLAGYIVPFMFVYGPALLLIGSPARILLVTVTAFLGVFCLAVASGGYLIRKLVLLERAVMIIAALFLIAPLWHTIFPGLILMLLLGGKLYLEKKRSGYETV